MPKRVIIVIYLAIIAFFAFNVTVLHYMSGLDLFDFFSMLYKVFNLLVVAVLFITLSVQLILFSLYFKHRKAEKAVQATKITEDANLNNKLNTMLGSFEKSRDTSKEVETALKNFILEYKNEYKNGNELKDKLKEVIRSIVFDKDNKLIDALFREKMFEVKSALLSGYKEFKHEDIMRYINMDSVDGIVFALENVLLTEPLFNNSLQLVLKIARRAIEEYNKTKMVNPDEDTKVLIARVFKVWVDRVYPIFIKNITPVQVQALTINKNNKIRIEGDDNNAIQDLSAEQINIHFNSK